MAVHSTDAIIDEAVHQALPGDGTADPWKPVAAVDFKFMVATNDWDPENPPSTSTDGSQPAVFIVRESQGAQNPQSYFGLVSATGPGAFLYSIFVQVGAGKKWHRVIDEEIRTELDDWTGGYVTFITPAAVATIRGQTASGFFEIAYSVPAFVVGDFS